MAIGADIGVDIEVIEEDELIGKFVMIGRDLLAEDGKRGIAIAFADVAQDLIVGPVFLDDVDDVFDG